MSEDIDLLTALSGEIAGRETMLDNVKEAPLGTAGALAHARKEWGHAAQSEEHREFHLGIVRRDLRVFDELMESALSLTTGES